MLESLIAISLICLIFFGAMQLSQMYAAREILHHAAARGARAKTVGFNWWMVRKAIYVASIPNSGHMLTPNFDDNSDAALLSSIAQSKGAGDRIDPWMQVMSGQLQPSSFQHNIETARIPEFMLTRNQERGVYILNYEAWEENLIHYDCASFFVGDDGTISPNAFAEVTVWQDYTNWFTPFTRTFYAEDSIRMEAVNSIENHYPLYIDDQLW